MAGLLALHTVRHILHMRSDHGEIRPWMSVPYIARTHHVPPAILYKAIGLPPDRRDHRPIGRIARQQGRSPWDLVHTLQNAVAQARGQQAPSRGSP